MKRRIVSQEEGACSTQLLDAVELLLAFCNCTSALAHPEGQNNWKLIVFLLCAPCRPGRCIYKGRTRHSCHGPPLFLQVVFLQSQHNISSKMSCLWWGEGGLLIMKKEERQLSFLWQGKRKDNTLCPCQGGGKAFPPSPLLEALGEEWKPKWELILFLLVRCSTHSRIKQVRLWNYIM